MKLALYYDRLSRFLRDEKPETISAPTLWLADVILYFVFGLARRIFFFHLSPILRMDSRLVWDFLKFWEHILKNNASKVKLWTGISFISSD